MYTRVQGNREHGPTGNTQRTAELKHAECGFECERAASYFRRARDENPRVF